MLKTKTQKHTAAEACTGPGSPTSLPPTSVSCRGGGGGLRGRDTTQLSPPVTTAPPSGALPEALPRPFSKRSYSLQKCPWWFAWFVSLFHRRHACEQIMFCTLMRTCRRWGPVFKPLKEWLGSAKLATPSPCVFPPPPPPMVSVSLASLQLCTCSRPHHAPLVHAQVTSFAIATAAVVTSAFSCVANPVKSWRTLLSPFRCHSRAPW